MDELNQEVQSDGEEQKEAKITITKADLDMYIQDAVGKVREEMDNHYKPQLDGLTKKNSELFKQIESTNSEKLTVEEQVEKIRQELAKERDDKRWMQAFSGLDNNIVNVIRTGTPEEIAEYYKNVIESIKSKAVEDAKEEFAKKYGREPAKGGDINVAEIDTDRFKKDISYAQTIKDKSPELYQKYKKLLRG